MAKEHPGRDPLRGGPRTKVTSLRLPADLAEEISAVARVDGLPISELVRAALYQFITARRAEPDFKEQLRKLLEEDQEVLKRLAE